MARERTSAQTRPGSRTRRRLLAAGAATVAAALLGRPTPTLAQAGECSAPPGQPLPFPAPDPAARWDSQGSPSNVQIVQRGSGFSYLVGGEPTTIHGMGYNPPVAGLTTAER